MSLGHVEDLGFQHAAFQIEPLSCDVPQAAPVPIGGEESSAVTVDERTKLLAKLRRIEALHAGAATLGERDAAAEAHRRITARIKALGESDPPVEFRFSLDNRWSRILFLALLRRYGLRPYRYARQRRTTVMVRVPRSFVDDLWQEFLELDQALREHLDEVAEQIIAEAIASDTSDAQEVGGLLA